MLLFHLNTKELPQHLHPAYTLLHCYPRRTHHSGNNRFNKLAKLQCALSYHYTGLPIPYLFLGVSVRTSPKTSHFKQLKKKGTKPPCFTLHSILLDPYMGLYKPEGGDHLGLKSKAFVGEQQKALATCTQCSGANMKGKVCGCRVASRLARG